ncbi:zinc metalloprotease [Anopheles sinensis]|uniref:Zinc metalloprotease n=1 Tax=Anopheles sinensis TaxID=74873 RepID=A0A084VRQ3_ANOSI|nr:zinc metalloprotease [Anopheles sinensis]
MGRKNTTVPAPTLARGGVEEHPRSMRCTCGGRLVNHRAGNDEPDVGKVHPDAPISEIPDRQVLALDGDNVRSVGQLASMTSCRLADGPNFVLLK